MMEKAQPANKEASGREMTNEEVKLKCRRKKGKEIIAIEKKTLSDK